MGLTLVIGNKNYSSWSMRPWVLMHQLGLPFEERLVPLSYGADDSFQRTLASISPAGRVPVLVDEGFVVWDTLAITEYLHERHPQAGVWPSEARARARARSLCAEMHSGFAALRSGCPMNIEAELAAAGARVLAEQPAVQRDLARIDAMWCDALATSGGPFLFGAYSAADAFYAPVCMRVRSYGLPLSAPARAYWQRVCESAGVAAWIAQALAEKTFLAEAEPYRRAR